MFADLHFHSTYSDGTNSPRELIDMAVQNNISALALSDHDTVDGLAELQEAAAIKGIKVIPAVELSTSIEGVRIHILGYNIDCNSRSLKSYLKAISEGRTQNTKRILERLNSMGMLDYSWEDAEKHFADKAWICSLDIFEAMRLDGIYKQRSEWREFYNKLFGKNSPAYMDLEGFTSKSAIEVISGAGGIPVVAHPKLIGDDSQLDKLVKYGLRGIEVHYPAHSESDVYRYNEYAEKFNLLITGGTDWHGDFTQWNVKLGDYGIDEEKLLMLERG